MGSPMKKGTLIGIAVGGAVGVAALTAAALPALADATPTPGPSASSSSPDGHDPSQGGHQANGITEQLLTGDTATKVTDAVKAKYPDATIERVETDAEGAVY